MVKRRCLWGAGVLAATMMNAAFSAAITPLSFTHLGDVFPGNCTANSVSDDGVVVGWCSLDATIEAFRWSADDGFAFLGHLDGATSSRAEAISGDGLVIVGGSGGQPFRWTEEAGMVGMGHLVENPSHSIATAVSYDGSFIAGSTTDTDGVRETWRWSAGTGMVGLGLLYDVPPMAADAYAISGNGGTVVGREWYTTSTKGTHWTAPSGNKPVHSFNVFYGVSHFGNVLVGTGAPAHTAKRLTSSGLSNIPQMDVPLGVSGNGFTIVGRYSSAAQIWRCGCGSQPLKQYLLDLGVQEVADHSLGAARAISPNGKYVIGSNWIARIPKRTDLNADGVVNIFDLLLLLGLWGSVDPCHDITCNGQIGIYELFTLLAEWGE